MIELLFCQLACSLPVHFFAYAPFIAFGSHNSQSGHPCERRHLRWSIRRTVLSVMTAELLWLLMTPILLNAGLPYTVIELTSLPLFGILFFRAVDTDWNKTLFLYLFSIDYLMALRGTASFLEMLLFGKVNENFYTWQTGVITFVLFLITMPLMLWFFYRTIDTVLETNLPNIWTRAWQLPLFITLLVMLFTYPATLASSITIRFFLARVLLLVCMFFTYYFVLKSIEQVQQQITAEEHARSLKQISEFQAMQYSLLQTRMEETRRARHDLRQHLSAIQGYIDSGDQKALASYIQIYRESIPRQTLHNYSGNYAVDSVLGFYAEHASRDKIQMEISFCPIRKTVIPEPEFCVLLGNLLENALEACHTQTEEQQSLSKPPCILVRAQKQGNHMFFLTIDNTSPRPPIIQDGRFLSTSHEGFGIGTKSVKSIAEKYSGDARFEWREGVFYVSVMLSGQEKT